MHHNVKYFDFFVLLCFIKALPKHYYDRLFFQNRLTLLSVIYLDLPLLKTLVQIFKGTNATCINIYNSCKKNFN
jgi:hypothetical protein